MRADALASAGGIDPVRGALIDDCALASVLKRQGPIWVGLTTRVSSMREYPTLADIRRMVARSAYAQLRYSLLLLAGTVGGMLLIFVAPVLMALFASGVPRALRHLNWGSWRLRFSRHCGFTSCPPCGVSRFLRLLWQYLSSPSIPPTHTRADAAEPGRGACKPTSVRAVTITPVEARSGKGHRDENFPVASRLIHPRHRAPILAFYEFVRTADDIADHAGLAPARQARAARPARSHTAGAERRRSPAVSRCVAACRNANCPAACTGLAYRVPNGRDQAALSRLGRSDRILHVIRPCRSDASCSTCMGRAATIWPANDALCAALQIINHLQDCGKDYRDLDRVYIPLETFAEAGAHGELLGRRRASPALLACIRKLADRTAGLLAESRPFSPASGTGGLLWRLPSFRPRGAPGRLLRRRDPLSERVHLGKTGVAGFGLLGLFRARSGRVGRFLPAGSQTAGCVSVGVARRLRSGCRRARHPAAPSISRCAFCRGAQREAMFEIYSFCRQVDDIADSTAHRERSGASNSSAGATDIDALYAGTPTPPHPGSLRAGARFRAAAGGFPRRHRRHGNGCHRGHPRAR